MKHSVSIEIIPTPIGNMWQLSDNEKIIGSHENIYELLKMASDTAVAQKARSIVLKMSWQ